MFLHFALAEPDPASAAAGYYFTQGVLGVTVVVLVIAIRFMFKYYTGKIDEKDIKIELLQNARLEDNKIHTADYREMAKNDQTVLLGNAQAQELMAGKIESAKARR